MGGSALSFEASLLSEGALNVWEKEGSDCGCCVAI